MTCDWRASEGNAFTLPLGLTLGKAVVRENGDFWDFAVGVYPLAVRPEAPRSGSSGQGGGTAGVSRTG